MLTGSVAESVGQTPLIEIVSLSRLTGCRIFGKAEFLNPGGSIKDRAALGIITEAELSGKLKPGYTIVEGTAGNTAIGLATLAAQKGYSCLFVMPNNQAEEKFQALRALGAEVHAVEPCPFANEKHFYHTARRMASERKNAFWADQFENLANSKMHYQSTGPEIWAQTEGLVDAFVSSAGTGGTIAGVSRFLKERNTKIHIRLADPMGSGLYSHFKTGKMEALGSSITEGIGIMRLTENFKSAMIDEVVRVDDQEMISMLYHLAQRDGLCVGTSAALNVVASYRYALENKGKGLRIVTVLCDAAQRYHSKIFNPTFLKEKGLNPQPLI